MAVPAYTLSEWFFVSSPKVSFFFEKAENRMMQMRMALKMIMMVNMIILFP